MDPVGLSAAAAVLALGVLAPGFAVVRGLRLASDALLTLVLSAAIGRLLFAGVTLIATTTGGRPLLFGFFAAAAASAIAVALLRPRDATPARAPGSLATILVPAGLSAVAALVLIHAVVARSGLENAVGDLVFVGRDSTNDPLVYGSMALRLAAEGLPLQLPFAGGGPAPAPYGTYALLAGLQLASGAGILDLAFRLVPAFDAILLSLSGVALVRVLGGGPLAAAAAGVLLALGGDAGALVGPVGALLGQPIQNLDSWALFGPYLAAFNPIAPAAHTLLAACAALAGLRGTDRAAPVVIGLLVAALFELKLFLWAPAVAGLAVAAFLRPPPALATPLRVASLAAILGSLPSLADRALWLGRLAGRDETSFQICVGCLPRYLANAAWGNHDLSFAIFQRFRLGDLLDPVVLATTFVSGVLVLSIAIGARAFAVPALSRGIRDDVAGRAAAHRVLAAGAFLGLGASFVVVTSPHFLNAAQFTWTTTFGLWPVASLEFERLWRRRRFAACGAFVGLAFVSTPHVLGPLGYRAPVRQLVPAAERALLAQLAAKASGDEVVLEPSMLADPDRPSPVPWLTGQPVRLSLMSAVQSLPAAERDKRYRELLTVFRGTDRDAALRAIADSGVAWVYAPAAFPLRFDVGDALESVATSPAGTLYRVPHGNDRRAR